MEVKSGHVAGRYKAWVPIPALGLLLWEPGQVTKLFCVLMQDVDNTTSLTRGCSGGLKKITLNMQSKSEKIIFKQSSLFPLLFEISRLRLYSTHIQEPTARLNFLL